MALLVILNGHSICSMFSIVYQQPQVQMQIHSANAALCLYQIKGASRRCLVKTSLYTSYLQCGQCGCRPMFEKNKESALQ